MDKDLKNKLQDLGEYTLGILHHTSDWDGDVVQSIAECALNLGLAEDDESGMFTADSRICEPADHQCERVTVRLKFVGPEGQDECLNTAFDVLIFPDVKEEDYASVALDVFRGNGVVQVWDNYEISLLYNGEIIAPPEDEEPFRFENKGRLE